MEGYTRNYLGYSFHTLVLDGDKIVGANSLVPINYCVNGEIMKFVNSGGTMISKSYRGIENFYDMIRESYRNAEAEGFVACTGFPNDNSYPLFKGTKLMRDIGKMHTYMLPFRIGGVKKSLIWLNPLSQLFSYGYVFLCGLFASKNIPQFSIHKDHKCFDQHRYNSSSYIKMDVDSGQAIYTVTVYEGVRTAFIIDVTKKSAKNFQYTVKEILKREYKNIDLILYVGNLPFGGHGMIKVPRKYEPKNFNFTGQIFDKKSMDKKMFFDFDSWDVNLSNYDLI